MLERQHYSTKNALNGDELTKWREYMSTVYYSLDIVPVREDRIRGELTEAQFSHVGISSFKADAQKVIRSKSAAQHDKSENFVFLFPTREALAFEQNGRRGLVMPGCVALINSADGYVVDVPDRSENITLKIPCDSLRTRLPTLDDACGMLGLANPYLVPVVSHLGEQLLKFDTGSNARDLQQSLLDLVCLMMDPRLPIDAGAREHRSLALITFDRVAADVRENFRDPNLNPVRVAERLRISQRYLHRVCQLKDQTFGRLLLDVRLVEAHRLLTMSPTQRRNTPIGDIAYACGFVSQAHFATRFRERFGMAPRELQQSGQRVLP